MQTRKNNEESIHCHKNTRSLRFLGLATSLLLIIALASFAYAQSPAKSKQTSAPTAKQLPAVPVTKAVTNEYCLGCHGPYEKVFNASANYTFYDGSKINPHITVDPAASKPHASGKGILECAKCHELHPIPITPTAAKNLPRAELKYCFGCHHTGGFTSCNKCHEGRI